MRTDYHRTHGVTRYAGAGDFSCRRAPRMQCPQSKASWRRCCARYGRRVERLCACNAVGGLMLECMQRARSGSNNALSLLLTCLIGRTWFERRCPMTNIGQHTILFAAQLYNLTIYLPAAFLAAKCLPCTKKLAGIF